MAHLGLARKQDTEKELIAYFFSIVKCHGIFITPGVHADG